MNTGDDKKEVATSSALTKFADFFIVFSNIFLIGVMVLIIFGSLRHYQGVIHPAIIGYPFNYDLIIYHVGIMIAIITTSSAWIEGRLKKIISYFNKEDLQGGNL